MRSIVSQLFQAQKPFAKWLLYTSLAILLLAGSLFGILLNIGNENIFEQSNIAYEIGDIVTNQDELLPTSKTRIAALEKKLITFQK